MRYRARLMMRLAVVLLLLLFAPLSHAETQWRMWSWSLKGSDTPTDVVKPTRAECQALLDGMLALARRHCVDGGAVSCSVLEHGPGFQCREESR
jgi:hypothetical protein